MTDAHILDRIRIEDVMLRERAARDGRRWDDMASAYHPDSIVEVSWYKGDGLGFVAGSRAMADSGVSSFHVIGQSIVSVRGDRALVDTDCTLHGFFEIDGCDVDVIGMGRMLWRMQKYAGNWLIAGLRGLYIRDMMVPLSPNRVPQLDREYLKSLRQSYRHIAYVAGMAGRDTPDDLPGIDRPDLENALRLGEQSWLAQGGVSTDN